MKILSLKKWGATMAELKINHEYIVKINAKVETDLTDEEIKDLISTLPEVLADVITDEITDGVGTVDVEPVKHGEWKYIKSGEGVFDYYFECSECHASTPDKAYPTNPNFCPHCGSKNVSLDCGICCLNYKGGKEAQE